MNKLLIFIVLFVCPVVNASDEAPAPKTTTKNAVESLSMLTGYESILKFKKECTPKCLSKITVVAQDECVQKCILKKINTDVVSRNPNAARLLKIYPDGSRKYENARGTLGWLEDKHGRIWFT